MAERGEVANHREPPDPDDLIPSQRRRRQAIIEGALSLLEQSTYDKIQMRDVAQEGNVALGTGYRYFASKEHLFAAVLLQWALALEQRVLRGPLQGDSPAERLRDMMSRVLSSFERWPQFYAVVSLMETTSDTHAQAMNNLFQARTNGAFRGVLEGLDDNDKRTVIEINNARAERRHAFLDDGSYEHRRGSGTHASLYRHDLPGAGVSAIG